MNITHKHIDALRYVASGDYRRPGGRRPDLNKYVDDIREEGLVCIKIIGDGAKICLTVRGEHILSTVTK